MNPVYQQPKPTKKNNKQEIDGDDDGGGGGDDDDGGEMIRMMGGEGGIFNGASMMPLQANLVHLEIKHLIILWLGKLYI
jgi:hypothetical protein